MKLVFPKFPRVYRAVSTATHITPRSIKAGGRTESDLLPGSNGKFEHFYSGLFVVKIALYLSLQFFSIIKLRQYVLEV